MRFLKHLRWWLWERGLYAAMSLQYWTWYLSHEDQDYQDYERLLAKWCEHLWTGGLR